MARILVGEDQTVRVGTEIAEIEEDGVGALAAGPTGAVSTAASSAQGGADSHAAEASPDATAASVSTMTGPGSNGNGSAVHDRNERISPLARRLAQEYQVDLHQILGTGEGGRVRKEDILAYVGSRERPASALQTAGATMPRPAPEQQPPAPSTPQRAPDVTFRPTTFAPSGPPAAAPSAPSAAAPPVSAAEGDEIITPSPMRRMIAEHMVRSKHTSPHATTIVEVDMTGITRWLDRNRDEFKQREGYGISYVPFVIKAAVEALKEFPYLNASWTDDNKIVLRKQIHVGVSIALDNGLIVPVIRNADTLNIAGLARAVNDLATRARSNRLQPHEVQGATFTVNNPGVFGTVISVAIINQPNAGILTMDAVVKRPVVVEDAIAIRSMMFLGISFDHRVVDGGTAAPFLASIRRRLEAWGPGSEVF